MNRMSGRRVHPGSGRTYHVDFHPPKQPGVDDVTGEELIQRDDDQEETVRKRLEVYHEQTKPLIDYYRQANQGVFTQIDGTGELSEIQQQIFAVLDQD